MTKYVAIEEALRKQGFLSSTGLYAIVDGQFGSTGKGLLSGLLAEIFAPEVDYVTSNAGPNSGHTSYYEGEKIVLRQLPTFGVTAGKMGLHLPMFLNAGAVIDIPVMYDEIAKYAPNLMVSPFAAVIDVVDKIDEASLVGQIGSTGKGVGAALATKVSRHGYRIWRESHEPGDGTTMATLTDDAQVESLIGFMEVSQGYSLGLNAGFYPFCTSRDCTVGAALSDAGIHPFALSQTAMVVRTFPIRVAGNSGPVYPDQEEIQWDDLGQTPELTTVTQKVRRVFTWSEMQFHLAVAANRPDVIFLNFCNYLRGMGEVDEFVRHNILPVYKRVMGYDLPVLLLGFGPLPSDVKLWSAA